MFATPTTTDRSTTLRDKIASEHISNSFNSFSNAAHIPVDDIITNEIKDSIRKLFNEVRTINKQTKEHAQDGKQYAMKMQICIKMALNHPSEFTGPDKQLSEDVTAHAMVASEILSRYIIH